MGTVWEGQLTVDRVAVEVELVMETVERVARVVEWWDGQWAEL